VENEDFSGKGTRPGGGELKGGEKGGNERKKGTNLEKTKAEEEF